MKSRMIGKKMSQFYGGGSGGSGNVIFKGEITQPSEFPTTAEVQTGWEYIINNPAGVTDNDPTKTNTGLTFPNETFIIWTGTTWATEGGGSPVVDDGVNVSPVNARNLNVRAGQTITIDGVDVVRYANPSPTVTTSGGIPAGSTFFSTPKTFAEYVVAVNYTAAYSNPAFTSFAIAGIPATLEVGQKIAGVQTLTWGISSGANVQPMSLEIMDTTNAIQLKNNISIASPTTYDFNSYPGGGLEYDDPTANTWLIEAHNTLNAIFQRFLTINWYRKWYGGAYAATTFASNADILNLSSGALSNTIPSQVTMATGGYFHLVVPTSYVQPTVFKNHVTEVSIGTMTVTPISVTNSQGIVVTCNDYCSPQSLTNPIVVDIS